VNVSFWGLFIGASLSTEKEKEAVVSPFALS
jgi:hypothetical protein